MTARQIATFSLVLLAAGACRKRQAPPVAGPTVAAADTAAEAAARRARERAEADSIAAANARRERTRRAEEELARSRALLSDPVYFEFDSEVLSAAAEEQLRAKADALRANPSVRIRVEGHADARGSTEYNLALGQRRAEAVRAFFTAYGISPDRVEVISFGEERPAEEGEDESSLARNRRAEFVVTTGDAL